MSKWPGKYVIGLTGNIGTGKSVVRRMLEHLGAYSIDADALAHRAIAKGAPGYAPVVELFGRWVVGADGQIDRARLGRIVFADPQALAALEKIVHPLVNQAIDIMARRATQPVIVIEAIKLIESGTAKHCDSIWVTTIPPEMQVARLVRGRGMSEADARTRIQAQPPQQEKIAKANQVILNTGSFEDTWKKVMAAWHKHVPGGEPRPEAPVQKVSAPQGELSVFRGRPRHSAEIAALINRLRPTGQPLKADDVMAAFGEKAFLLLQTGSKLTGLIGYQVENLVARTTDILLDPAQPADQVLPLFINEMERSARELQCEASLVFAPAALAGLNEVWKALGYERREVNTLNVQAWQEAARESRQPDTLLLFKQLRVDRVLRPI